MMEHKVNRLIEQGHYEEALLQLNSLVDAPGLAEEDRACLTNAKVVLLVLVERFDEALSTFKASSLPGDSLYFERAYAFYRLGKYQAAHDLLLKAGAGDARLRTLKAQVCYRLNRCEDAAVLYKQLLAETSDDDESREHLGINYLAATAGRSTSPTEIRALSALSHASHEAQYNYACVLATNGHFDEALDHLETLLQWHRMLLEKEDEDEEEEEEEEAVTMTSDQINEELASVLMQKAFVLDKLRRSKEASEILETVKPRDESLQRLRDFNQYIAKIHLSPHLEPCEDLWPRPAGQFKSAKEKAGRQHLYSVPNLTKVEAILQSCKLTASQRAHLLLNHTLGVMQDSRLSKKQRQRYCVRTWRKLLPYPSLGPLATVFLHDMLPTAEINSMAEECPLMWAMRELDRPHLDHSHAPPGFGKYPGIAAIIADKTGCSLSQFTADMDEEGRVEMEVAMIFERLALDGDVQAALRSVEAIKRMGYQEPSLSRAVQALNGLL